MDISKYEYVGEILEVELEGHSIRSYTPRLIVAEKLRAICQQMDEYGTIIKRGNSREGRAQDFYDITDMCNRYGVRMSDAEFGNILSEVFDAKHVPLELIGKIPEYRDVHALDFPKVRDNLKPGSQIESFDYYYNYVVDNAQSLHKLWDK